VGGPRRGRAWIRGPEFRPADVPKCIDESAVTALMSAFDIRPMHWEESVAGSWYRRIWGQVEGSAPSLEEIVPKAVRAVEMKTLLSQQAGIDAAQGDALAKLISSLAAENTAVIQMGSMLLVKARQLLESVAPDVLSAGEGAGEPGPAGRLRVEYRLQVGRDVASGRGVTDHHEDTSLGVPEASDLRTVAELPAIPE
jgi:hypothetical protein